MKIKNALINDIKELRILLATFNDEKFYPTLAIAMINEDLLIEEILDELENAAMTQRSAAALKQIVLIFCAACHIQDSMPSPSPFLISQAYNFYIYSFVFETFFLFLS